MCIRDREFSMHYSKEGVVPGKKIGQFDAKDINWVSEQLQQLVTEKNIPPKVLVIHRFRTEMVSHAPKISLDPRVQIVMDMDGWGPPWMKFESYRDYIDLDPVEFTGFKLFFHNDVKRGDRLLTPAELLWLRPRPLYIQFQWSRRWRSSTRAVKPSSSDVDLVIVVEIGFCCVVCYVMH